MQNGLRRFSVSVEQFGQQQMRRRVVRQLSQDALEALHGLIMPVELVTKSSKVHKRFGIWLGLCEHLNVVNIGVIEPSALQDQTHDRVLGVEVIRIGPQGPSKA